MEIPDNVKPAHWIVNYYKYHIDCHLQPTYYICSKCGKESQQAYPLCPHCGEHMYDEFLEVGE